MVKAEFLVTPVSHVYMLRSVEQAGTACRAPTLRFARFSVLPWAARVATAVLLLAGLWSFVSCSGDGPEGEGPEAYEIQQAYEDDAVSLTLKVSRREITAADRVELVLEALTPEEQQIEFPSFDEKLGEFAVVDSRTSAPRLVEGGRVLTAKSFELEPFLPGEYTLPVLTVRHGPKGADEDSIRSIETTEQTIDVQSVLPDSAEPPDIKEIAPPVDLPREHPWWLYAAGVLTVLALAAGYFWWKRRKRADAEAAPPPPAHEVAYRTLEELLAEDLLMKGEAKLFYLRLSNILRHYIEDRFGLRAPERTTEEFMDELRSTDSLEPAHKGLLKDFLRHCDMVKFAEHQPSKDEVDDTIASCRRFIDETKVEAGEVGQPLGVAAAN